MPPPQQQQGGNGDNSMAPVWITVLVFITLYAVWSFAHAQIVSFIFFCNITLGKLISLFIHENNLANDMYIMQTVDPSVVTWQQLFSLITDVGVYLRYPVGLLLLIGGIHLYRSDITLKFHKTHDMFSLRAQEQHNWPSIAPVIKQDLVSLDLDEGPWAAASNPVEFARKHNLLKKSDLLADDRAPGAELAAGIKRGDAKRVFTLQLGPIWDGFDRSPLHAQALAAVFMARMNRDKNAATMILNSLNKESASGKMNFHVATATLNKYKNTDMVQEISGSHAYLLTVMASLLHASRDDGVVPSADFLWLKVLDRRLWYMLNCVGRQTPFAEVAGPFAHWLSEKAMKRPLLSPMIDEAIKALEVAVKEVKLPEKELGSLPL
jgi:intracellular multiplication protein IcmP